MASFARTDAQCKSNPVFATGGTITVASIASGAVAGSFALNFGGDTLRGSFDARNCTASINELCPQSAPSCG